ncbi:hypothetical protein ACF3NG_11285 [Aerococcaceae bacterium WGS1372]
MKKKFRVNIFLFIIVLLIFVVPIKAEELGNQFIESNYSMEYEEALEISTGIEEELEEDYNRVNHEISGAPISFSFESDLLRTLIEKKFGDLVEVDYLDKLLINGDLTEIYMLSLDNQADYSVEDVVLIDEDREGDMIKEKWSFTLVEQPINKSQKEQSWSLESTIYTSKNIKVELFQIE